jgi:hypothetical protein
MTKNVKSSFSAIA